MIRKEASPLFVQIYISTGMAFQEMVVDEKYVLYPNRAWEGEGGRIRKGKWIGRKGLQFSIILLTCINIQHIYCYCNKRS